MGRRGFGFGVARERRAGGASGPPTIPLLWEIDFTASEVLDARITPSGGANGQRFNAAGVMVPQVTPRFDYRYNTTSGLWQPAGLLIEPQRTNSCLQSAAFDSASWTKIACTIGVNAAMAPDGTMAMDKIQEDATNGAHYVQQSPTVTIGTACCASVFVKAAERSKIHLQLTGSPFSASPYVRVDLATGLAYDAQGAVNYGAIPAGPGIWRVFMGASAEATAACNIVIAPCDDSGSPFYQGVVGQGLHVWGAQLESMVATEGVNPSSHIPTAAATVTRTIDTLMMTGANFTSWWNASEGTFVGTADSQVNGWRVIAQADAGANNNSLYAGHTAANPEYKITTGGSVVANIALAGGPVVADTPFKMAWAYQVNNAGASYNGGAVGTDLALTVGALTRLVLGKDNGGQGSLNGHLRKLGYVGRRCTNAELIQLATLP